MVDSSHAALKCRVRSLATRTLQLSAPAEHAQAAAFCHVPVDARRMMNIVRHRTCESQYSPIFGTSQGKKRRVFKHHRVSRRSTIPDFCIKKSSCAFFTRRKIGKPMASSDFKSLGRSWIRKNPAELEVLLLQIRVLNCFYRQLANKRPDSRRSNNSTPASSPLLRATRNHSGFFVSRRCKRRHGNRYTPVRLALAV